MEPTTYSGVNVNGLLTAERIVPSLDGVMDFLHSIKLPFATKKTVCRQLQMEVDDEHIRYMRQRLQESAKLEKGWDGYGDAIPINPIVIDKIKLFLESCKPSDLLEWSLFPNINGTMLLEQDDAAISIASKEFSYYAENGDKYIDSEGIETSVSNLIAVVKKINAFMQE